MKNKITFNAHRGTGLLSNLIVLFSRGLYSHISIELEGYVYEARFRKGVIKTKRDVWNDSTVKDVHSFTISRNDKEVVKAFLEAQVGKTYDVRGVIAFIFTLTKPKIGAWFCSELGIVALSKALGRTARLNNQLISPTMFWDILQLVTKK
jgi:hypothetical protein